MQNYLWFLLVAWDLLFPAPEVVSEVPDCCLFCGSKEHASTACREFVD